MPSHLSLALCSLRMAVVVDHLLADCLCKLGLSKTQLMIIQALAKPPSDLSQGWGPGSATATALAHFVGCKRTSVVMHLQHLVGHGLVEVHAHARSFQDGRMQPYRLTRSGKSAVKEVDKALREVDQALRSLVTAKVADATRHALTRALDGVGVMDKSTDIVAVTLRADELARQRKRRT